MRWISDDGIARLREAAEAPDFSGTRYRIDRELGRGGMGVVWAATDLELQREVAVKVLPLYEGDHAAEERLTREARTLASLEHPGIVPVHDLGHLADGRVFYAMKLVKGERLDRYLQEQQLSLADRMRLLERICEPVAFAHSRGIVHRDLKPSNIMIGSFGEVLVLDWGLARSPAAAGERAVAPNDASAAAGTPGYMAPEQARGEPVDARADVHALGAILGEVCAADRIPRPLEAILRRACAERPEDRYPDAALFAADIARWLDRAPVVAYRENLFERVARWISRHRTLVALVVAYLVMRALVIIFFGR